MKRAISLLLSIILMLGALSMTSSVSAAEYNWAGSWGTPALESGIILGKGSALSRNGIHFQDYIPANSTVRTVITPTLGGTKIRLKFSNIFGTEPVTIDEVTVAKTGATNDLIKTDTVTNVTFNGGSKSVTIAVGSEVLSDEIDFKTTALEKISVSMFFDKSTPMYVIGLYGGLSYICTGFGGNRTHNENMTRFATKMNFTSGSITYYTIPFLTRVDVYAENAYSVVLLGDSTVTNDAYIYLAEKVNAAGIKNIGFVMSGIIGNALLRDGAGILATVYGRSLLERAQRDAFSVPGVRYIIVKIGANDVLHPMLKSMQGVLNPITTGAVIQGYRDLSNQNQNPSIRMYLCTRTPFKGYTRNFFGDDDLEWTPEGENKLLEINSWIKANCVGNGGYTGCINLDKLRDPSDSAKLRSQLTTDGIHFNELGQIAFVDLIPEAAYGVNRELRDIAQIKNVNPYTAVAAPAPTTTPSANNGSESTTKAPESTTAKTTPTVPSTNQTPTAPAAPIAPVTPNQPQTQQSANQIFVDTPNENNGINANIGNEDSAPSKKNLQLIGFAIIAIISIAIVGVSGVMLTKYSPSERSLSRPTYNTSRKKNTV